MKYIIFIPIALLYTAILSSIAFIACLWSFDFKENYRRRKSNINHKLKIGYWLGDIIGV